MSVSYGGDSITFADGSVQSGGWTGMRNRIINGAMEIDQRNAGASVTVNNNQQFPVDRFIVQSSTSTQFTAQRSTTAPTGFSNSLLITTSTANASAFNAVWQRIEANNTQDLDLGLATAKTFTVSFWVRSSVIGTYTFYAQNNASSYSYVSTYTINVVDTWEYKTITIAAPTAGTWLTGTDCSLQIAWSLGGTGGTTSTLNSWQVANVYNASGATGIYNTGSATFYITGVQVERGSTASSFDYRSFGNELALCQRYYEVLYNDTATVGVWGHAGGEGGGRGNWFWHVAKRAQATVALACGASWTGNTPQIFPGIDKAHFYSNAGYFYSGGTAGTPSLTATAEL